MVARDVVLHTLRVMAQAYWEQPIGIRHCASLLNYLFHMSWLMSQCSVFRRVEVNRLLHTNGQSKSKHMSQRRSHRVANITYGVDANASPLLTATDTMAGTKRGLYDQFPSLPVGANAVECVVSLCLWLHCSIRTEGENCPWSTQIKMADPPWHQMHVFSSAKNGLKVVSYWRLCSVPHKVTCQDDMHNIQQACMHDCKHRFRVG